MSYKYKGLAIINAFANYESTFKQINRLTIEFNSLNVKLDYVKNTKLLAYITSDGILKNNIKKDYDFIIYLDKDKYIAEMLKKLGYRIFNDPTSIALCDDKMLTHIHLSSNGIKMPKTISYPLCYSYNNNYGEFKKNILYNFSFPFLIKENYGSLGKQIYLINNSQELLQKEKELRYKPHLYQEYISESCGIDYRLILIGNKIISSMKRVNESSFVANISSGGKGYSYTPSKDMEELAIKASSLLNLDYCGIDFILNKNSIPILIEVNSNAFFNEIEKVTQINVAKKYCEYIISKLKEDSLN